MANRIKAVRESRDLPLESLARRVGTSTKQISHLEAGTRHLTIYWLNRLGTALDCHPWELVGDGSPAALDSKEIQLLEAFRLLPSRQRRPVLELVESLVDLTPVSRPKA